MEHGRDLRDASRPALDDSRRRSVLHLCIGSKPTDDSPEMAGIAGEQSGAVALAGRRARLLDLSTKALIVVQDETGHRRCEAHQMAGVPCPLHLRRRGNCVARNHGATATTWRLVATVFWQFSHLRWAGRYRLLEKQEEKKARAESGREVRAHELAGVDAAGAAMGSVGLAAFAVVVWQLLPRYPVALVLSAVRRCAWFADGLWRCGLHARSSGAACERRSGSVRIILESRASSQDANARIRKRATGAESHVAPVQYFYATG